MTNLKLTNLAETWDRKTLDTSNWQPVDVSNLDKRRLEKFHMNKRALKLYFNTDDNIDQICKKANIGRSALFRLVKRATLIQTDGLPLEYLACISRYRLKQYERKTLSDAGTAGRFHQFLHSHPGLKDQLDGLALGAIELNFSRVKGSHFKSLWKRFRKMCSSSGIDISNAYPFSNKDGGREAVRRYVHAIRQTNFVAAARIAHGSGAARFAAANSLLAPPVTLTPYSRAQLDGHLIDALFNVRIQDPQGNDQDLLLSRIWLLVLIDVASRAVLGYSLSLSHNYTSNDVLDCIASSFDVWAPLELPENSLKYLPGAGLPCGVIDACRMRSFDTIQMDNAWSQLSQRVQERILSSGATNRPCTPRADAFVERFNRTFESLGFHEYPNTTGTGPTDPCRQSPEKAAKRLNIQYEDLKLAADVIIANYNAKSSKPLNGRSPLDYIAYRLDKGEDLVRYADAENRDGLKLYECDFLVTIKASLAQGHKPYIQFKSVRYTSEKLQRRLDLKDARATFRVNTQDIRQGQLFDPSGKFIDRISAEPRWLLHPHTMATRRVIMKLIADKSLKSDSDDPVSDHLDHLSNRAILSRKARNELVKSREHEARFRRGEPVINDACDSLKSGT